MKLSEKVAYLKGLGDGLKLDPEKSESKLITGIIDVLEEVAEAIDLNTNDILEMTDRVDEIDMDLGDLEAILFEGFEVEEFTEEDLDELGIEDDDAFAIVYSTDEEEAEEEELDDAAIFAAADEVVAEAEAAEAAEEEAVEEVVEEVEEVAEEVEEVEEVAEEAPVEEVVEEVEEVVEEAPAEEVVEEAAVAAAAAEAVDEVVEEAEEAPEVVEREAEPEEDIYEVECPSCGVAFTIDESILQVGSVECPKCHEKLEFEIEYE